MTPSSNPILIDSLTCEGRTSPLGIGTALPRYGWRLAGGGRGVRQTAYRLLVASSRETLTKDTGDLWDSGWVETRAHYAIEHAGPLLPEMTTCWWKVMARVAEQNADEACVNSQPATFETGILKRTSWLSWWARSDKMPIYLRREFVIPAGKRIGRARAYIGAIGEKSNACELRLNGARVGDEVLCPGQTHMRRALYRTLDVTSLLQSGANAVAIIFTYRLVFQLDIHFTDGTREAVFLGRGWHQLNNGPYLDLRPDGKGETYDARLEPVGWDLPGFDDRGWPEFAPHPILGRDWGPRFLDAQQDRVLAFDSFKPRSIRTRGDGACIIDFGQNMNGVIQLHVTGDAGTRVALRYAEILDKTGSLDPSTLGAEERDEYILRGDPAETYQLRFSTHAFRFVEVGGWPGELRADQIEARAVHSDILADSRFDCSDERINRLHHAAVWAFRSNLVSVPTDCPGRERFGWTGDAHCHSEADCLNFRMGSLYDKWMTDIADAQSVDGLIPWIVPAPFVDGSVDVPWLSVVVLLPWDYYQSTGDASFLRRHYLTMRRWVDSLLGDRDENHLLQRDLLFGDWAGSAFNGGRQDETRSFVATAFYYQCLTRMNRIAAVLGESADAGRFARQAEASAAGLNRVFARPGGGYDTGTQTANALALASGFVPAHARPAALEKLAQEIEHEGTMTCGCLGAKVILDVLAEHGRNDVAWRLVTQPCEGGWGYWLTLGATTALETFSKRPNVSHNHAFLAGGLDAWFYKHLAGIQVIRPGYDRIRIRPWFAAPLTHVTARVETVKGVVASEWRREDGHLTLDVCIPPNAEADIHLPTPDVSAVKERGKPLTEADGVIVVGVEDAQTVVHAGSGNYQFAVRITG